MSEEGRTEGFWRTIPGVLTALAGTISAVAGLVIALSQAGLMGSGPERPPPDGPAIDGVWTAQVIYPWATHRETFDFRVEEGKIHGTASFLGLPRAIEEGTVAGQKVSFLTRAEQLLGTEQTSFENRYDGSIADRGILFILTDTRGNVPVEFTAVRKRD
jgi:hypothetical protein